MKLMDTLHTGAATLTEKLTGEHPALLQEVTKLVQNTPDGVSGLLKQFHDKGLGAVASSLTGDGIATPISPDDILKGFGPDRINALASASGLDAKVVCEKLVTMLPKVIRTLTPGR